MHRLWPSLALFALGCSTQVPPPAPAPPVSQATPAKAPRVVEHASFGVSIYGTGPSVVLIPGLTCGGHVWDATVDRLKSEHTVHVLTLSGFAGRPSIEGPLLPTVRDELAAYLRELDRPVVIGHSLGGFMALWLAATEPELVAGAIAVDGLPALAALSGQESEAVATFAAQMRVQMASQSQEAFAEQTSQTLLMQISDPEQAAAVSEVSGRSDPAAVGQAMQELLTTDLRPQLSGTRAPVLLLGAGAGTEAQAKSRSEQYRAQIADIPHHRLVMVPGTRHFVMLDAPEVFWEHVDRFLAEAQ